MKCLNCPTEIKRTTFPSGKMETLATFLKRKFCKQSCSTEYNKKHRIGMWKYYRG